MATGERKSEQEKTKCGECKKICSNKDKCIQCELCELWFHAACEDVSEDTYKLMNQDKVHFYCGKCNKTVGKIMDIIKCRQDKMEIELIQATKDIKEIKEMIAVLQKEKDRERNEYLREVNEMKLRLSVMEKKDIEKQVEDLTKAFLQEENWLDAKMNEQPVIERKDIEKQVEDLTNAFLQDEKWSDILKKKVEEVSGEMDNVRKMVVDTKELAEDERDREQRRRNIIVYRVPESTATTADNRKQEDFTLAMKLMEFIIAEDFEQQEITKVIRLGRKQEGHNRPLMIQLHSAMTKNYIMQNTWKLKEAPSNLKGLIVCHDLTIKEREECKKLVEEAKTRETDDLTGEWIYRVRGTPGKWRIVKWRRRY